MPTNFDALIRYHTIDKCLQNHFRKWSIEDLGKACFEALDEVRYRSEKNTVSQRTIENDIRIMRSDLLGYNAPIKRDKGYYFYSDKTYSIKNATLSQKDIENISLAAKILGQYKGFSFIENLSGILNKIETRIKVNQEDEPNKIVQFEHIPESKGTEYIHPIIDAIRNNKVVELGYKRFDSHEIKSHIIHPYLLKEFRNRWYLLGLNEKHHKITTYALDRFTHLNVNEEITYHRTDSFLPETYFKNTIGIGYSGTDPVEVIIKISHDFAPYLLTQPLHESQELISTEKDWISIKLKVVHNEELQTLLMGYSDLIEIVSPQSLIEAVQTKLKKALKNNG